MIFASVDSNYNKYILCLTIWKYSVFVGTNTSLAHDSMVHGPAWVGNNTFVGMDSIIIDAKVGNNVAIGISSTISNGVSIPHNKFVPPRAISNL